MLSVLRIIDSISEWSGRSVRWFAAVLVVVMTTEAIMRYAFSRPTEWSFEISVMLGATIYVLAWSYTHRHRSHIRVDVIYARLSPRAQAIVDVIGTLFFSLPLIVLMIYASIDNAWASWIEKERLIQTLWYPPAGPIRTVVALGFILLALQIIAQFVRDLHLLITGRAYE